MGFPETFKALSDPTRREILNILKDGAKTAGEIGRHFDMTGATVSHHLSVLRDAQMVSDSKRGKYIFYELNMSVLDELIGWAVSLKEGTNHEKTHLDCCVGSGDSAGGAGGDGLQPPARADSHPLEPGWDGDLQREA